MVEHAWWCDPTIATFGNMGAFIGGEHFFLHRGVGPLTVSSIASKEIG
jgi:hypothetical protein